MPDFRLQETFVVTFPYSFEPLILTLAFVSLEQARWIKVVTSQITCIRPVTLAMTLVFWPTTAHS